MYTNQILSQNRNFTLTLVKMGMIMLLAILTSTSITADPGDAKACPTIVSAPTSTSACVGSTATFSVTLTGESTVTYQWKRNGSNISGANSSSYTTPVLTAANNGDNYSLSIKNIGCSTININNCILTVNTPAAITTQPISSVICAGSSATLKVVATGSNLTYQWSKNGVNISGATSATYTIASTTSSNNGTYNVVVSSSGCNSVTSNAATLTVNTPTNISAQPVNKSVCSGSTATFSISATGSNLTYQWRKNGTNISGATAASYTTPILTSSDNNSSYSVVISNAGCSNVTSNTAVLTVATQPTISTQPTNVTVCNGSTATFSAKGSGNGLSYQWTKNGVNISGATSTSYTTPATSSSDNGAKYNVLITNTTGCSSRTNDATLTVNEKAVITTTPVNKTACAGSTVTFSVVATGTNLSYQWTKNGAAITNATSASYTTPTLVTGDNNAKYRVVISNAGCGSITSTAATLTVHANAVITAQPVNKTVCAGSATTFNVTATGSTLTYQWRKNGVNISGATAASYTTPVTTATDNGTIYSVAVTSTGCASVISNNAILTVNTAPSITTQPVNKTICVGTSVSFSVTATGTNLTYQWKKNGSNISGATSATYTISSPVATDNGATYTVVVSSASCTSKTSTAATLTVNNTPVIITQPSSKSACSGSTATFTVVATGTNLKYQWRKNGTNISGATAASYTTPATSSTDNGVLYSVVVTSCTSVTSSNATLTILALPAITSQPVSKTALVGGTATFSVTATGTGLSYQWMKNGTNISGATSTSYTLSSIIAGNAGNYSVKVTNSSGCSITSSIAVLSVSTNNQWIGGTTDWFNASNWSGGIIPNLNLDVTLPAGRPYYPVITGTAIVKNIIISNGASLSISTGGTIQVYGDFVNSGTFNAAANSNVTFTGITAQNISGSNVITFDNLNINNSSNTVSISTNINLINTLTLAANSKFNTTGYSFTVVSNATATGRIAVVPSSATFTGNINMQRYIAAEAGRYWYHISSPVTNGTVEMWQNGAPTNGIYITGLFTGASNPGNGIVSTGISAYTWNPNTSAWSRFPENSNTENLVRGKGYRVFVRDGGTNVINTSAKTVSVTGTPNTGDQTYTLSYNTALGSGWNMIGNPYPSNINANLNNSGWTTKNNLDGYATYIWNSYTKSYLPCNGGIGACTIPSSQAFWVKVKSGGGTLVATENVKVANTTLALYDEVTPSYIPVTFVNGENGDHDITYIRFENDATEGFDDQYDAYKLFPNYINTSASNSVFLNTSIGDTIPLSIQALPIPTRTNDTLNLTISGPQGNHMLDFSDRTHLNDSYKMYLIDSYNGNIVDLNVNPIYHLDIFSDTTETITNRFKIVIGYTEKITTGTNNMVLSGDAEIYPNPVKNNEFYLNPGDVQMPVTVNIFDLSGRTIFTDTYPAQSLVHVQMNSKIPTGTYIVESRSDNQIRRSKIVVE